MLGRHDEPRNYDTVVGDDVVGAQAVMDHLIDLGHSRIAHLTEPPDVTVPGSPHALRLETYLSRMAKAGFEPIVSRTGHTSQTAHDATVELLARPDRPTAVFAGHDQLAIGALAAIAEHGLTAADVSVVGYDDTELAAHPAISLTSVDQSGRDMSRQAVTLLLERIQGRTEPRKCPTTPELRVRRSTAPPPGGGRI